MHLSCTYRAKGTCSNINVRNVTSLTYVTKGGNTRYKIDIHVRGKKAKIGFTKTDGFILTNSGISFDRNRFPPQEISFTASSGVLLLLCFWVWSHRLTNTNNG